MLDPLETLIEFIAVSLLAIIGYILIVFIMLEGGSH